VSVGHVARLLEESGIATVVVGIAAFEERMAAMHLPRLLTTPQLMGRPLGAPGDVDRQRAILRAALDRLETAERSGTVVRMPAADSLVGNRPG